MYGCFRLDFDPRVRHTVWGFLFGWIMIWSNIYGLSQASVQRYCATASLREARQQVVLHNGNIQNECENSCCRTEQLKHILIISYTVVWQEKVTMQTNELNSVGISIMTSLMLPMYGIGGAAWCAIVVYFVIPSTL